MLDEKALRKPTFREGTAVTLGDGQEWTFPKPTMRFGDAGVFEFRPVVGPDGKVGFDAGRLVFGADFGPDYDALLDALTEAEDGVAEKAALAALAFDLLGRNYDLSAGQMAKLLPVRPADEANQGMWQEIAAVAVGRVPKLTPSGSGAPA